MTSSVYADILQKKLNKKLKRKGFEGSIDAKTTTLINQKALELKGSIALRMEGSVDREEIEAQATEAAAERVSSLFLNTLNKSFFDPELFKNKRIRAGSKVRIPTKISGIRDKRGRFVSAFNLARTLNLTLYKFIKERMTSPRLVYRTGRFANSALISSITGTDTKTASIAYRYMLYPYQVFEKDSIRDPRKLIKEAIRAALDDYLSPTTFKQKTFNIREDY